MLKFKSGCYIGLRFCSLLLELFFLFVLLIIYCSRCWCRFGGMMRARLTLRMGWAQPRHPLESSGNFPPCTSHACNKNKREQLDSGYVSEMKMKLLPKSCSSKYVINSCSKGMRERVFLQSKLSQNPKETRARTCEREWEWREWAWELITPLSASIWRCCRSKPTGE